MQHAGTPQTWMASPTVQPTKGLAIALSILLPLSILLGLLQTLLQPTETVAEAGQVDFNRTGWGALTVLLSIASLVVGLVWVFRVTSNASAVGDPRTPSPGWAVGSWFIPVAHLLLPFFPLKTAWQKSRGGSLGLLSAWWAFWALHMAMVYVGVTWGVVVVGLRAGLAAAPQDSVVVQTPAALQVLQWTSQGVALLAGVLFLMVVWRFQGAQERMAAWLQGQAAHAAASMQATP